MKTENITSGLSIRLPSGSYVYQIGAEYCNNRTMNMTVKSRRCRPKGFGVILPSLNKKGTHLVHKNCSSPTSTAKRRRRRLPYCSISYTYISFIIIIITSINYTYGQDSNHFFCGTSWADASDNCEERQHCPSGTDDECETEGHICFGGTTCDSKQGHGNKFKYANVPYDDISNTRFCGSGWQGAIDHCSIDTHCPSGFTEECPEGYSCYGGLPCNVKDIIEALEEANISPDGEEIIDKHSPKRHNFCGSSWADANSKCSIWCPSGEAVDCPGGMNCFGSTGCYQAMPPTSMPISEAPTLEPTPSPAAYKDPMNVRYCGTSWAMAVRNCSPETWCPGGTSDECPEGQSCHAGITECNMVDLMAKEKGGDDSVITQTRPSLSSDDPRNSKFCGKSWQLASDNCSLKTHCPDDQCPAGDVCYGGINGCNANDMTHSPSRRPTQEPSDAPSPKPTNPTSTPSFSPTTLTKAPFTDHPTISSPPTPAPMIDADDMRNSYFCGKDWADVTEHCHQPCISGQDTECPDDMNCIAFTSCRPKTPPPTNKPATESPSPPPVVSPPTTSPVTDMPSRKPVALTLPPTEVITTQDYNNEEVYIPNESPPTFPPITMKPIAAEPVWDEPKRTFQPTQRPSPKPITPPTTPPQAALPPSSKASIPLPSPELIASVGSILVAASSSISNNVLVRTDMMTMQESPSQMYQFSGFINALGIISKGDMGSNYFYLGSNPEQPNYGLANVALFLAQAAVESVQYDICDDISWEKDVFGRYPIANSCGQGKSIGYTSYEETNPCSADEAYMACNVDVEMKAVAKTHGIFSGAPPPLECFPSTPTEPFTGAWNPAMSCIEDGCSAYTGQTMGRVDPQSIPTANSFGTKSVDGCCWWGRGPYPRGASGTCMIGKLNYFLAKRAFDEDRPSARYEVDFCKDPSAICRGYYPDDETNSEIRWLMGLMYWMNKVQTYNRNDWSYMIKLHEFVDGGYRDAQFLTAVSGIVTKGRHDSTPILPAERKEQFDKIMDYFKRAQSGTLDDEEEEVEEEISMATTKPSPLPSSTRKPTLRPVEQTNPPSSRSPSDHPTPGQAKEVVDTRAPVVPLPLIELLPIGEDGTTSEAVEEDENYSLTPSELAQRLNFENNYCATSAEEAEAKCATTLRTCNFDDDPCTFGLACYGNVACKIKWSDGFDSVTTDEEESAPDEDASSLEVSDSPSGPVSCNGICLRPLSANECLAGGDLISILPDCFVSSIGEMCQTEDKECINDETTGYKSACPGGSLHAFMHVIEELCGVLSTEVPSTDSSLEPTPSPSINTTSPSSESLTNVTNLNDTNITNPQDNSLAAEEDSGEFSWTPDDYEDDRPSAWWILNDSNGSSSKQCSMSIAMLFLTMASIIYIYL